MNRPLRVALRPDSSIRQRLLLAATIWTVVGAGLLVSGVRWLTGPGGPWAWIGLAVALGVGVLKGRYVLAGRARANSRRIVDRGEPRCVGGVFSWGTWLLVGAMTGLGVVLRHSPLSRAWLGVVYTAVGTALLGASWVAWQAWRERR